MFREEQNKNTVNDYVKAGSQTCSLETLRDLAYSRDGRVRVNS